MKYELDIIICKVDCYNITRKALHQEQHKKANILRKLINRKKLSFSHSYNYVIAAGADVAIGIDFEKKKHEYQRTQVLNIKEKCLSDQNSFTFIWTLKESIAKLFKCGLLKIDSVIIESLEKNVVYAFVDGVGYVKCYYQSFKIENFILTYVSNKLIKKINWRFIP